MGGGPPCKWDRCHLPVLEFFRPVVTAWPDLAWEPKGLGGVVVILR
jgi:hypothetical protein